MIYLSPIVFRAKINYKPKKVKKLALNSQLLTVQILTIDVQVLILCLSYFITTVPCHRVTLESNYLFVVKIKFSFPVMGSHHIKITLHFQKPL